jgi:hypothetical protein
MQHKGNCLHFEPFPCIQTAAKRTLGGRLGTPGDLQPCWSNTSTEIQTPLCLKESLTPILFIASSMLLQPFFISVDIISASPTTG